MDKETLQNAEKQDRKEIACCIAAEDLSASTDGEYVFSAEELSHLSRCEKCRALLESFRQQNSLLQKALNKEVPPSIPYLMQEKVRERLKAEEKLCRKRGLHFSPGRLLFHSIFLVVIFLLAAYFLTAYFHNKAPAPALFSQNPSFKQQEKSLSPAAARKLVFHYDKGKYKKAFAEIEQLLVDHSGRKNILKSFSSIPHASMNFHLSLTGKEALSLIRHLAASGLEKAAITQEAEKVLQKLAPHDKKNHIHFSFIPGSEK